VPGDETVTPFGPVADIVGSPIRAFPHRLAKTVRDDESYNRLRAGQRDYALIELWQREADKAARELNEQISDVVIAIGLAVMLMGVAMWTFA
jgi:hypothetical protein